MYTLYTYTCEFSQTVWIKLNVATYKSHRHLTKVPVPGIENFHKLLVRGIPIISSIVVAFDCLPYIEGKTILVKIVHTDSIGTWINWPRTDLETSFMSNGSLTIQDAKEKKRKQ